MADDPIKPQRHLFDFISSSFQPYAPLRSMPNAGFRDGSFNGMMHDGQFRKRGSIIADTATISVLQNGAFSEHYNGQSPADIQIHYIDPISSSVEGPLVIWLTTNECFVITVAPTTVTNVTPRYSTGTISITNGTAALSGTGTDWVNKGIVAGQLVNLPDGSATWYAIDVVGSGTSITLKTNYTGATLTNQPYTIRRTGRNSSGQWGYFARIFNGDLYYTYCEGNSNFCVVRVEDILSLTGVPTIIGANTYDNGSGCDIWTDVVTEIKGMELLTDGRVVLATTETASTVNAQARIRYSSHLDQKIWNSPPGGVNDVVNLPGKMNAMRDLGAYLSCHYDVGIVLATPTGQDDPPLTYQRVQGTKVGAINSRAIANTAYGQAFLGADSNVYVFDGSSETPLSDAPRKSATGATSAQGSWHACYETARQTFWLFDSTITAGSTMYGVDLNSGIVSFHKTPTIITAACDPGFALSDIRLILGLPSYDPAASGTAGATSTMIYDFTFASGSAADVVPAFTSKTASAAITLITDWLDFGMPGIDKTLDHVLLYYESTGTYTMRLTAKRDGLSTDPVSITAVTTAGEEKIAKFMGFPPKTSEKWQFTFDTTTVSTTAWDIRPRSMVVFFRPVEGMEAVPR